MAKHQIMFYATARDLSSVLSPMEAERPLQYTLTGLFETSQPLTYLSYTRIPEFGRASHSTAAANASYLVSCLGATVRVREVLQKAGGVLFAVDQMRNEEMIVFRLGGRHGNNVILCGMIGTVSQSAASTALYNFLVKRFRKSFLKKRGVFVGREAFEIWNAGARLTIGALSPPEFDLKRDTAPC